MDRTSFDNSDFEFLGMWNLDDVIAAVASAPGAGRRGIVRVSGPNVQSVVAPCLRQNADALSLLHPGRATRVESLLAVEGLSTPLPAALYIWPDHRSYAGQPTIEIHTIGSPPILNAIVETVVHNGARVARPGEFTLRSFLAGKIDLVQAEAVLGVIDADSSERLQQALAQLAGGVSGRIRELREQLLIDLADLEAGLDFVEEDIEFVDRAAMTARLETGVAWLRQLEDQAQRRGQTTGRKSIVLAGLPNAGKSTLFNALVRRDAAVVSAIAGTTRDWLTEPVEHRGLTVDLIDTAGAEEGDDDISAEAQSARWDRLREADLVVWCTAADLPAAQIPADTAAREAARSIARRLMEVTTRQDLSPGGRPAVLAVSARTGEGMDLLKDELWQLLSEASGGDELITTTLARCSESLGAAREALERAAGFSASREGEELVAFELRRGLEALGEIAGVIYTDDLLDRIFSRFCIGK